MPCYHPLAGYRSRELNPSGKRSIVFNPNQGYRDMPVDVPCGQCIGCRLERSRVWAVRCMHEAQMHEQNCFLTLTYRDSCLPHNGSLELKHFQDFMKRFRFHCGEGIRFFHCGEYGEKFGRPHYHAIIFGFDFPDKILVEVKNENSLYTSDLLDSLWPHGLSRIGAVSFDSAAYVARYVTKKITGPSAEDHYTKLNLSTGELAPIKPEYTTMSRRPGIGKTWYETFKTDVFPHDYLVVNGKKTRVPKYYASQYEITNPVEFEKIKLQRVVEAQKHAENNTLDRRLVRETIQKLKMKLLNRRYEKL